MRRGPGDFAFGATAGCVIFTTAAALTLIVYALLMFVTILSEGPAQQLVGTAYR